MATPQYRLLQADTQDTPESGYTTLYAKTDGLLYYHPYGGSETEVGGGGTPAAHASTHASGGSDELTPADIGAAAATHTHAGGDITSAVAEATNADTVDGYHASAFVLPPGMIAPYGGTNAPSGWLLCDGSAVSRTTYADLFAAIGTAFGYGNGSSTFHLPDLRGRFLRGRDGPANRDPDAGSRSAMNSGGNSGDNVGSVQDDAFQGHYHQVHERTNNWTLYAFQNKADLGTGSSNVPGVTTNTTHNYIADDIFTGDHGSPRVSTETRPENAYVNFIIKT